MRTRHKIAIGIAIVSISPILFVIGLLFFSAFKTGYTLKEMDWNNSGMTSISEILFAGDVGKRKINIDTLDCVEFFDFKDGLPIKLICRDGTVLVGPDAIIFYQNRHGNNSITRDSIVDMTIGKSKTCPIHKTLMRTDTVPNIGHANLGLDYVMVAKKEFPYSQELIMGNSDFNKAIVFVCEKCIEAEKQWREEQEKKN